MSGKRILITGGCGFVGANVIQALRSSTDCEIRVLDNESTGRHEWIREFDVEFLHGDIRDNAILGKALIGMDAVIHLAADTRVVESMTDPKANFDSNVVGSFNLLSEMREAGVMRLVNASTGGAILGEVPPPVHEDMVPRPISPYGASKLAVEGYCSAFSGAYGMHAVSLRFSNVYGVYSYHKGSVVAQFFKNIIFGKPLLVYGDGTQTRDYIFSKDLSRGVLLALNSGKSGVIQLGSGKAVSLNELIEAIRHVVAPEYTFEVRYESFRKGEIRHTHCNIEKAARELGFVPETELRAGLEITWEWFKRNRHVFGSQVCS